MANALLTDFEKNILKKLEQHFYDVVPHQLKTYCVVDSQIACQVLNHFDMEASLYPCQMRHYSAKGIYAVGFVEGKIPPSQWNGHVICKTQNWFLDASLFTLSKNFQVEVPLAICAKAIDFKNYKFARYDLVDGSVLRWFQAPENFDLKIPDEPKVIVQKYADEIIKIIDAELLNQ